MRAPSSSLSSENLQSRISVRVELRRAKRRSRQTPPPPLLRRNPSCISSCWSGRSPWRGIGILAHGVNLKVDTAHLLPLRLVICTHKQCCKAVQLRNPTWRISPPQLGRGDSQILQTPFKVIIESWEQMRSKELIHQYLGRVKTAMQETHFKQRISR